MASIDGNKIDSIVIVGGGTAGWMAALMLSQSLKALRPKITLVESSRVGTIGVGEATVPPLVRLLRDLELDEADFMRRSHATYKLGIKFVDWYRRDHAFWHPFGWVGGRIDDLPLFFHWQKARAAGRTADEFDAYSTHVLLAESDKSPRPVNGSSPIIEEGAYAYHLDAAAFADYMKDIAVAKGVVHVVDDVKDVVLDERGFIDHVATQDHGELPGDLFLDCTGFRGLLIEQAMGDGYIDWGDHLMCDRAVVHALPQNGQMPPYTRSTGLNAGWVWQIPLTTRIGCGYVYSSRYTDDEAATRELLAYAKLDPAVAEPRYLKMRVGRRENFWVRNCVSIGLAAGFIEPLESTGIFLIQRAVQWLLDHLPDKTFNESLIQHYNRKTAALYQEIRDFIVLHYILTERADTDFWSDYMTMTPPDSLQEMLTLYDETGIIDWEQNSLFRDASYYAILAGFQRLPRSCLPRADLSNFDQVCSILELVKKKNAELATTMPAHADMIAALNRPHH